MPDASETETYRTARLPSWTGMQRILAAIALTYWLAEAAQARRDLEGGRTVAASSSFPADRRGAARDWDPTRFAALRVAAPEPTPEDAASVGGSMPEKVNLAEAFGSFQEAWSPRIAGAVNGVEIRLAKFRGEFLWHRHDEEDELFLVNKGNLLMRFRDREIRLGPGEFIIVPRGTEHMPVAESEECEILNLAPRTLVNTGNVINERTRIQLKTIGTKPSLP